VRSGGPRSVRTGTHILLLSHERDGHIGVGSSRTLLHGRTTSSAPVVVSCAVSPRSPTLNHARGSVMTNVPV
jgi:hypothetical protein